MELDIKEVDKDIFLIKNAVSDSDAEVLMDLYNYYKQNNLTYTPRFLGKYPMNLEMISLGHHWCARDNKYYDTRVDVVDKKPVPKLDPILGNIAAPLSEQVFPYHNPVWDICIINKYSGGSSLGMHQDKSESKAALDIGHPIVSISLGASCQFIYGPTRSHDKAIILDNRDVLIFGGSARLMYHGIKPLKVGTRLNFTLRKI